MPSKSNSISGIELMPAAILHSFTLGYTKMRAVLTTKLSSQAVPKESGKPGDDPFAPLMAMAPKIRMVGTISIASMMYLNLIEMTLFNREEL